ncbi:MAG: nucleoside deaminase [Clostridia bacterium]|nr:nucleoside deaminase [Clostridia bacterium]
MGIALKEAEIGIKEGEGGLFGCVIVKNGEIIAKAHNRVLEDNDPTSHGEINALQEAGKKLKTFNFSGCELYTTGQPCPMCLCACMWANIDKIYYGCSIEDNEKIGFRDKVFEDGFNVDYEKIKLPMQEIDRAECLKLFDKYKKMKNKKLY